MDQVSRQDEPTNYYQYVFENSIKSDIEIVLKDKVIKAHKEVLGKQNPVFLDKFISQPALNKIEILDLNPNAVEIFIHYLYTGKLSHSNVSVELFRVAHKYLDLNLKNACREKFVKTLTTGNAVQRLLYFLDREEANLTKETSIFIAKNFNDIKSRADFNQVLEKIEAITSIFDTFGKLYFLIIFLNNIWL